MKPTRTCPLKWLSYESVVGTLTGVPWNALSSRKVLFYVVTSGSLKGTRNFDIVLH